MRSLAADLLNMAVGPLAQIERLDVGQHRVQAGKQGEEHAAPSFPIAAALPIRLQEAREETADRAMHIKALAGLDDALGRRVRIAVETPNHASNIAVDEMVDMASEPAVLADQRDARVNFAAAPAFGAGAEQTGLSGDTVIGPPAMLDPHRADVIVERDVIIGVFGAAESFCQLNAQRIGDPLVDIQLQYPGASAQREAGVAAIGFDRPGAFQDTGAGAARHLGRAVGAAIEHDHDVAREGCAPKAIAELAFRVARDDQHGQIELVPWYGRNAHAASLMARCHNSRAAVSTASTDRPSINVPVVR